MMNFTTFDKKSEFKMEMGFYQGDSFNNKEVINKRFCFILIENGSGILKINNKEVPFISPVIFC